MAKYTQCHPSRTRPCTGTLPLNLQHNHILTFPSSFRNPAAQQKPHTTFLCMEAAHLHHMLIHTLHTYIHTYASRVDTNMPFLSTDAILMHSYTIHRDTLGNSTRELDPKYCSNNSSAINEQQQHGFPQSTNTDGHEAILRLLTASRCVGNVKRLR